MSFEPVEVVLIELGLPSGLAFLAHERIEPVEPAVCIELLSSQLNTQSSLVEPWKKT